MVEVCTLMSALLFVFSYSIRSMQLCTCALECQSDEQRQNAIIHAHCMRFLSTCLYYCHFEFMTSGIVDVFTEYAS